MIDIDGYISQLIELLKQKFGSRVLYVGLQGSYLRGEATQNSDIDIMVVLDNLSVTDLQDYRSAIASLPHFDRSCGFICGKADLANWNPLEMCHLLHSTKDYYGILQELTPDYARQDIQNFVKLSINNLYHEICHRYIHASPDSNISHLPGTYKGVFFILQNLHYLKTGRFIATKAELLQVLNGKDRAVLEHALTLGSGAAYDFDESFALLFDWCQETLPAIG